MISSILNLCDKTNIFAGFFFCRGTENAIMHEGLLVLFALRSGASTVSHQREQKEREREFVEGIA